ncbi:MAG: hypothetical protein WCO66_03290 [Candidatus Absconditabacteria bacterium]
MVDPFFQKAQATQAAQNPSTPAAGGAPVSAPTQEIQTLLQQQQTLQTQYNQYAAYLQNPQTTPAQKEQVQQYLQQLSIQYQQIAAKLQQLGYVATAHVNKPVTIKPSSGSKISLKGILLGCLVVFIVLVGGLSAMFYYLIQNPNQLASVGLDAETTRSLLNTFSIIFFALVVFFGMGMLVINGYRLVSVKNVSKSKYAFGLLFGFLIFAFGLAAGYQTLTMIKNISVTNSVDNNKLVLPYIQFKNGLTALSSDPKIVLLAPSAMAFKLNTDLFNGQILPTLGQASFDSVVLDCGNKQTLDMNMTNAEFVGTCIYFNKGSYNMMLKIAYTNTQGEKLNKEIPAGTLNFVSEISVAPVGGVIAYNDAHTEMSAGKVPSKVKFDASRVFSDLGLANYTVLWDINGDGTMDQQNVSSFTTSYKEAKLYTVAVRFPEVNDYVYSFPLRVEQSDVPVCEVLDKALNASTHEFTVNFLTKGNIQEYQYQIMSNGKSIYTTKSKDPVFQYQLPASGIYSVKTTFVNDEGKQGSCESDDISVGAVGYQLSYSAQYKSPSQPQLSTFPSSGAVSMAQDTIVLAELPTIIQFSLDGVQPNEPGLVKQLLFDGKPVLSSDGKIFEIKVDTPTPHLATFVVKNPTSGATSEKKIQIVTKRDSILGKLIIKPDIVGIDPFTVTLDASTTTLNDASDEIIYFTWDFGDGEIKKNLSQSIMQHTYIYDATAENGSYMPKITIKTKKGLTGTITAQYPITVKKKAATLAISIDSHPSQIARVSDRVMYSLELNGVPKTVVWDFGNGKTLQCSNRECVQATTTYTTPGKYTITAKVTYQDKPEIEGSISLKVQ